MVIFHINSGEIMSLKEYLDALGIKAKALDDFAKRCGTTAGQIKQVRCGRVPGESLAINIERETGGKVRCEELRPDVDWAYIRGTSAA